MARETITDEDLDDLFKRLEIVIEENSIDADDSVVRGVATAHHIRNPNAISLSEEPPTPATDRLNEHLERYPPPETLQHRKTAEDWQLERLPLAMREIACKIRHGEVPAMVDVVCAFETEEPTYELRLVDFIHFLQYHIIPFLSQGSLPCNRFKRLIWCTIKSYMHRMSFEMGLLGSLVD